MNDISVVSYIKSGLRDARTFFPITRFWSNENLSLPLGKCSSWNMVWILHHTLHLQCFSNANNDAAWVIPSYITDNDNTNVIEQDAMTT